MSEIFYFYSILSTYPFVVDKMKLKEIYARGSINIACSACFKPIFQHEIHIFFPFIFGPQFELANRMGKEKKKFIKKTCAALCSLFSFNSTIHSWELLHNTCNSCFSSVRSKSIKTLLVLVWILMTEQFKQFIDFNQCYDQISRNQHWSTDFQFDLLVFDTQMPEIVESF